MKYYIFWSLVCKILFGPFILPGWYGLARTRGSVSDPPPCHKPSSLPSSEGLHHPRGWCGGRPPQACWCLSANGPDLCSTSRLSGGTDQHAWVHTENIALSSCCMWNCRSEKVLWILKAHPDWAQSITGHAVVLGDVVQLLMFKMLLYGIQLVVFFAKQHKAVDAIYILLLLNWYAKCLYNDILFLQGVGGLNTVLHCKFTTRGPKLCLCNWLLPNILYISFHSTRHGCG